MRTSAHGAALLQARVVKRQRVSGAPHPPTGHPATAWLLLSKYNNLISLAVNKQAGVGVAAIGSPADQWERSDLTGRRLCRSVALNTILVCALVREGAPVSWVRHRVFENITLVPAGFLVCTFCLTLSLVSRIVGVGHEVKLCFKKYFLNLFATWNFFTIVIAIYLFNGQRFKLKYQVGNWNVIQAILK